VLSALFGIGTVTCTILGPKILANGTNVIFDGVIGKMLPAGITKAQAVAYLRAQGQTQIANVVAGSSAVPGHGIDFTKLGLILGLATLVYLLAALLQWALAFIMAGVAQRTVFRMRSDVEAKMARLPLKYFDSHPHGDLLSRVTNDIDNIQMSLSMTISELLTSMLTVAAVLVMMLTISPLLTLIAVLTVPLSLLVTRAITRRSQRLFVAQWASTGRLNAHIEETYSGLTVVKTFGHRAAAEEEFRKLNDEVYQASFGAQFFSALVSPATMFIGNIGYVAVAVVGGLQVATGQITVGSIQAFIQYIRQFNWPLTQVAAMYSTLQSGVASAERVFELLDEPEDSPDHSVVFPALNGQSPRGRVEFQHVNFAYRPGIPVIEDLSLVAEPGSTVAIVGPTGAGKTTLVNLLMRFYEVDSGRILIDGVDIASVSRHSLRSQIGMVLQDTWLFGGTIAENISYGRLGATEDDVVEAAKAAYVDRFVHTLPDGYQTQVSDDGGNISSGEKQLITIARGFLARPQILVLDEATSSVDTRTERLIQHAMRNLRRDRTSFIIAHRLSTIRDADNILVVEAGKIVEQGSHDELMARRGAYYGMTRA
jgi:ATP-binding cassette subfamily B protein